MDTPDQVNIPIENEVEPLVEITPGLVRTRRSQRRIVFDRFIRNRTATLGALFLILLFLFCFLGPILTGHSDAVTPNITNPSAGPSLQFPFGSDDLGRDLLARAAIGGRVSLLVG